MRIVGLKEFLTLPPWTMYRKYQPCYTDDLLWKQDSLGGRDWVYTAAAMPDGVDSGDVSNKCDDMAENAASYPVENWTSRDGLFDDSQLFMIYEKADIEVVAKYVANALEACK